MRHGRLSTGRLASGRLRSGRGLRRKLPDAKRRGAGLLETLIAVSLLGMLFLSGLAWLETRRQGKLAELAGGQLALVATGARAFIDADFPAMLVAAGGGSHEITIADLIAAGSLPPSVTAVDAMRRQVRVLLVPAGAGALDVVVGQAVAAGDARRPVQALLSPSPARIGMVQPDTPGRVRGPAIDADVSAHQALFGGVPQVGALASAWRADFGSVYGSYLWRDAVPGFAAANTMTTALDMDGNDILSGGAVEAAEAEVTGNAVIGGDVEAAAVTVGRSLAVTGDITATGALTAAIGNFTGAVSAASLTSAGPVQAASATVLGQVTAGSFSTTGTFSAGTATVTDLQATRLTGQAATLTSVSAGNLTGGQMTVTGNVGANTAGFSTLTVGLCTGC